MMKTYFAFIFVFASCFALAQSDPFAYRLSAWSWINPKLKSCYRWMGNLEKRQWLKRQAPVMGGILEGYSTHLGRGGKTNKGIYCWSNPIGALKGAENETYGEELARIDFVDDAVIWDRNANKYYAIDGGSVPVEMQKGVDSEIFYANYNGWFQEYIIKDARVVRSFSFNDSELQDEFHVWLPKAFDGTLTIPQSHFFYTSYCPFETTGADHTLRAFHQEPKRYSCEGYRQLVRNRTERLEKIWATDGHVLVPHANARGALPR